MPSSWTHTRGRIAGLSRSRPPDDPELIDLRRQLKAERGAIDRDERADYLADHVAAVVAQAPPLTDEQLARVAAILNSAPRSGDAA